MNDFQNWEKKFNALPRIPRAQTDDGYVDTLKTVFKMIQDQESTNAVVKIEGSNTKHTLGHYIDILKRYRFIEKDNNDNYVINEYLAGLKESDFKEQVAKFLYENIKYISEMLTFLEVPRTTSELLQHANEQYNMSWKEKGQIHERVGWLSDLELINSMSYKRLYEISEKGLNFIKTCIPMNSLIVTEYIYDDTNNEETIELPKWILDLDLNEYKMDKKITLGYIPGGKKNATKLILNILTLSKKIADLNTIKKYLSGKYSSNESSINGFITFLTNLELLDRIGEKVYKTTEKGDKLIESDIPDLYLLFFIHKNYKYIFEILFTLKDAPQEPRELAARGVSEYDMPSESLDRIRERLSHLKNAKLILNDKGKKLKLSNRGELLCSILEEQLEIKKVKESGTSTTSENLESEYMYLLQDTRLASTDSTNPHRFEKLLEKIFIELGFETKLLAKSGTTDILLTAPTAPKYTYKVAIEAKTNREGKIKENAISFDALNEHKQKHRADFVVVIGKTFHGERLVKFAENNNVLLIDIEKLEKLVKNHRKYPLQAVEYKKLFDQAGIVDISVLDDTYKKMQRRNELFKYILETLIQNSSDKFTEGILTMREIYLFIKSKDIFKDNQLTKQELGDMLDLLSNPLIGCVGVENKGYYAKGSLTDAQLKFGFYYTATIE